MATNRRAGGGGGAGAGEAFEEIPHVAIEHLEVLVLDPYELAPQKLAGVLPGSTVLSEDAFA
jgi:hypothetical protein